MQTEIQCTEASKIQCGETSETKSAAVSREDDREGSQRVIEPRRGGGDAGSVSRDGGRSAQRDTSTHVIKTESVGQRWWCLTGG